MGLWASHRRSPPSSEGAAAPEEEEGGWQLPALLLVGVPSISISQRPGHVCAGGVMRAGVSASPWQAFATAQEQTLRQCFLGPKAEVRTLFKQQHGSGLINYLFGDLVSLW